MVEAVVKAGATVVNIPDTTEDVMDDADVAGLAMGWMSKGD